MVWPLLAAVFLSVCFWGWIFGTSGGNFWWKMTAAGIILSGISLWLNRNDRRRDYDFSLRQAGFGLLNAAALYLIFLAGGELLRLVFPGSGENIGAVYAARTQLPDWQIGVLLAVIIAPAEEIFWRGLIQKRLAALTSPTFGLGLGAVTYALVHLWAGNPVLLVAAFVCGVVWGGLYQHSGSLAGPIISHIVWDITIFLVWPLG
jgi:membrane protease YdiL (CAAX protease family)